MNPWYRSPLFFFHVLTHASIVPMVMYASAWQWAVAVFVYFMVGCIGVSITYHRLVSHRSFKAPKWFLPVGLACGALAGVGSTIQWTAVHREHHRFSDTERDPHNPKGRFLAMQFLTMLVPSSKKYVVDLLRDPLHVWFHRNYWLVHALYASILVALDPFALVYAYLFPALVFWHMQSSLATFAHDGRFGYQNFRGNKARNLTLVGWLCFGEGWHNNHHQYPASARFGSFEEPDLSYAIIRRITC